MRRWMVAIAAVAAVTCVGGASMAQGPGGGGGMRGQRMGGMMGGGLRLLSIPVVQQDLKMTQAQIDKIPAKQQEVQASMQELRPAGGGGAQMTPEERTAMMAKMQQIQQKAVADILDTTQQKRFRQIELQQAGPGIVMQRKDVATELKVTDEQKQKMQEVQRQAMQDMRNLMPQGGFQNMTPEERQALGENLQKAREATNKKMLAVLTDAQQKQWVTMTGTPIKLPAMGFGGRRGGQGGPGGGGGGGR